MPRKPRPDTTPDGGLTEARLHAVLGYQIAQANIAALQVFERSAGEGLALRPVEYTMLALIQENPGGTPAKLARALAVTAPNITMWVDKLQARGLVRRESSPTDRRAQMLFLTAEGERLASEATRRIVEAEAKALAVLSAGERAILVELLHKVACSRFDAR